MRYEQTVYSIPSCPRCGTGIVFRESIGGRHECVANPYQDIVCPGCRQRYRHYEDTVGATQGSPDATDEGKGVRHEQRATG
jgi:hypothetical protein